MITVFKMKNALKKIIGNKRIIIGVFLAFVAISTIQAITSEGSTNHYNGVPHTEYNNYVIFKESFHHLKNNQDLYIYHPKDHFDLYKYTPTFAAFFGIFSIFPDWAGLSLWGAFNALILLFAVYYLPKLTLYEKGLIMVFIAFELITSLQNQQSNALIAGLLILAFGLLEKKKIWLAALCIVFSIFIKPFGIVGLVLFLFYPQKWKSALYVLFWTFIFLIAPLIWIDLEQYSALTNSYLRMLAADHSSSYGYSVMGIINSWFSVDINKNLIVTIGVLLFLLPLYRISQYKSLQFKLLGLTSILIWIVIFNHKAESPTFVIAMAGVSIWFILSQKNKLNIALFILAIVLTSLSPTDLFPATIREEFVKPYALKALPCILIWIKIIYDMIVLNEKPKEENEVSENSEKQLTTN